jgi:hypothetical protein
MKNTKTFGSRIIGSVAVLAWTLAALWAANAYFVETVSANPHFAGSNTAFPASDNSFTLNFADVSSCGGTPHSIAFQSNRDGNPEIYVMNPDGSDQTRLTNNTRSDRQPDVSPNGKHIVFSSNRMTEQNPDGNFESS